VDNIARSGRLSPNNRMQRSDRDKVHAPDRRSGLGFDVCAIVERRPVVDTEHWAEYNRQRVS
jgi:hypothetical protein